jgi:Primase C terminal 2 (PriCT-2)/Bifunctional DNA primase/polymerase, N-terminal
MIPRDPFDLLNLYEDRGWALVPIPAGEKRAVIKGWNTRHFRIGDLDPEGNFGIRFGADSGGLVDVDLDCPEALDLADLYLPQTGAVFGRAAKPRSHRIYTATGAVFEAFVDPITGATLLELRADGRTGGRHQTIVPPSIADGERRQWDGEDIEPTVIDARVLRHRCALLAIGCLVMRYVGDKPARQPKAPGWDHPKLLWECDHELGRRAYGWLGKPAPDAPRRSPKPRHECTTVEIELAELAHAIRNDFGWEDWNTLGMAFWSESKGSEEGFNAFDTLSAKSPRYDPRETAARWVNYHNSPPDRVGKGTLIYWARKSGWRPGGHRGRAA